MSDKKYSGRSQFNQSKISREQLIADARKHCSRGDYLKSLGISKGSNLGLKKRMELEGLSLDDLWPNRFCADCRFPEEPHVLDLMKDDHAYFYGLALADGHLQENSRNRGKITIELKDIDRSVLDAIHNALPWKGQMPCRTRTTNFGKLSVCALVYHSRGLRKQLIDLGFPTGKKSDICSIPCVPFNELAFWRGFLDGDGSLGFIADGRPFLSVVTTSESIANAYMDFIYRLTGNRRNAGRNQRDNAYNIMIYSKDAVNAVTAIYPEGAISIDRKMEKARKIKAWTPVIKDNEGTAEGSA